MITKPKTNGGHEAPLHTARRAVVFIVTSVLVSVAIMSAFTAWLSVTGRLNAAASPINFITSEMSPQTLPLCPGDVMAWDEQFIVIDEPARVSQYSEVRRAGDDGPPLSAPDGSPTGNYLTVHDDVGRHKTRPASYTVPLDTPPGQYVYWRYAQAISRRAETYPRSFEVKPCP